METLIVVWRSTNVLLAAVALVLLLDDVRRRSKLHLRQRFYWQAVALMLVSIGWGTAVTIVSRTEIAPDRTAVATLALVYFLISILRVRRFNRREEAESGNGELM